MPRVARGPRLVLLQPPGYAAPTWFIRWHDGSRSREKSTGKQDETAAARVFKAWRDERQLQLPLRIGPSRPDQLTVAELLELYRAATTDKAGAARIRYAVQALKAFWRRQPVSHINEATCQRYFRYRRGRGARPSTIRRELGTLSAAGQYCLRAGELVTFPPIWLPETALPRDRWLTRSETARLLWAAWRGRGRHVAWFVLLGFYTGARREAITTLQWQPNMGGGWIDLQRRRIDFNPIGRTATKKRRAVIPIPRRLLRFLLVAREQTRQYVIERDGQPIGNVKRSFATACRLAGLKGVTPHTLRHTCATMMAQRGVRSHDAAGYLGMTVATYERVYAKHHPDFMASALQAFD